MKITSLFLVTIMTACGTHSGSTVSSTPRATTAPLRLTDTKKMKDVKLEALRAFVTKEEIWHDGAWGRFGNCHYQTAKQYSGDSSDIKEIASRAIYGTRHISYLDFKPSIQNLTKVSRDAQGANLLFKAMINNSNPNASHLVNSVAIADTLKKLITATANTTGTAYFTAKENWLDGDMDYTIGVIVDTFNRQVLVVASGNCDFPQAPYEG